MEGMAGRAVGPREGGSDGRRGLRSLDGGMILVFFAHREVDKGRRFVYCMHTI